MLAQCTAAALVSENKVLTHPSSVDSLTTSAGTEDHVSMGGFAARKALEVVEHVEYGWIFYFIQHLKLKLLEIFLCIKEFNCQLENFR